jgi:hypothetical protein
MLPTGYCKARTSICNVSWGCLPPVGAMVQEAKQERFSALKLEKLTEGSCDSWYERINISAAVHHQV